MFQCAGFYVLHEILCRRNVSLKNMLLIPNLLLGITRVYWIYADKNPIGETEPFPFFNQVNSGSARAIC